MGDPVVDEAAADFKARAAEFYRVGARLWAGVPEVPEMRDLVQRWLREATVDARRAVWATSLQRLERHATESLALVPTANARLILEAACKELYSLPQQDDARSAAVCALLDCVWTDRRAWAEAELASGAEHLTTFIREREGSIFVQLKRDTVASTIDAHHRVLMEMRKYWLSYWALQMITLLMPELEKLPVSETMAPPALDHASSSNISMTATASASLSSVPELTKYCAACPKRLAHKANRCGRCKVAHYCSRECQTKDWASHKLKCQLASG